MRRLSDDQRGMSHFLLRGPTVGVHRRYARLRGHVHRRPALEVCQRVVMRSSMCRKSSSTSALLSVITSGNDGRGGAGSRVAPVSRSCAWRCRMLGPRVYSSRYSLAAAWRASANFGSNWTAASRMAARPGGSGHATSSPSAFWAASAADICRRSTCNCNRSRRAQSSMCRSAWSAAMASASSLCCSA